MRVGLIGRVGGIGARRQPLLITVRALSKRKQGPPQLPPQRPPPKPKPLPKPKQPSSEEISNAKGGWGSGESADNLRRVKKMTVIGMSFAAMQGVIVAFSYWLKGAVPLIATDDFLQEAGEERFGKGDDVVIFYDMYAVPLMEEGQRKLATCNGAALAKARAGCAASKIELWAMEAGLGAGLGTVDYPYKSPAPAGADDARSFEVGSTHLLEKVRAVHSTAILMDWFNGVTYCGRSADGTRLLLGTAIGPPDSQDLLAMSLHRFYARLVLFSMAISFGGVDFWGARARAETMVNELESRSSAAADAARAADLAAAAAFIAADAAAASKPTADFVPSSTFTGARPGFVFKAGPRGVGFYRDARAAAGAASEKYSCGAKS